MIHWRFYPSLLISLLLLMIIKNNISIKAAPVVEDSQAVLDADSGSRHKRETLDLIGVLRTYGYLPRNDHGFKGQLMSNEMVTEAIRKFQGFNGLEVTGKVDSETIRKMQSPRCGFPDIINQEDGGNDNTFGLQNNPQAFSARGLRWERDTVYWNPIDMTEKLSAGQQWTAFQRALDMWAEVTPLKFQYSSTRPDIEIKFASGNHGDGWHNQFDGTGGVLAHAFSPGAGIGGDTHFDGDEDWTLNTGTGHDLVQVAAHEFGHALGLGHSRVPGALMAPYYIYTEDLTLHSDDVRGIQSLYGPRHSTTTMPAQPNSTTPTTSSSTTTTQPPPPTTTTTTTTTTTPRMPWVPEFCLPHFRLDAISKGPDGFIYAFRERHVYKIGDTGLELHFPKLITDVFPGAPRTHIRAVTYVPTTGKTYIFKDARVWRFTGFELDRGYPKIYSTDNYFKPSSALTLTHSGRSQIFLFSYDYFWEWSTETERVVQGYPLSSRLYFPSSPILPDAAYMNGKGNIFFFKYNRLRMVEYRGAKVVSYPLGTSLFGPICGINPENSELVTLEPPRSPSALLLPSAPERSRVKYDEAKTVDTRQKSSLLDILKNEMVQGKQPDYYSQSQLISSLLMNTKGNDSGQIEEVEYNRDADDLSAWL